jgi:hypothetical protein
LCENKDEHTTCIRKVKRVDLVIITQQKVCFPLRITIYQGSIIKC